MKTAQGGIFALGTGSHSYLEFAAVPGAAAAEVVAAIASLREPRTTMGGVNLVAGFRPSLWAEVVPDDALTRYTSPLTGAYYFVPAADSLRRFIPDEDSAG
jgi:porphyrinogen peroxidase